MTKYRFVLSPRWVPKVVCGMVALTSLQWVCSGGNRTFWNGPTNLRVGLLIWMMRLTNLYLSLWRSNIVQCISFHVTLRKLWMSRSVHEWLLLSILQEPVVVPKRKTPDPKRDATMPLMKPKWCRCKNRERVWHAKAEIIHPCEISRLSYSSRTELTISQIKHWWHVSSIDECNRI
jgi:hypothetical protein